MTRTTPPMRDAPVNEFDRKSIALTADFIRASFDDARVLDGIPDGATLILLPADDPAFVDESIQLGIEAIREGRDVVFRHVGKKHLAPVSDEQAK